MNPAVASARVSGAGLWSAAAALLLALATQGGCIARSYEIPHTELARLVAVPPVLRGVSVEVEQELTTSSVEPAAPVGERTVIVAGGFGTGSSLIRAPSRRGGSFGSFGRGGSSASDAKSIAVAVLVLATFGLIIAAAVEHERYEGTVRLHPMHPVHLFGHDGGYLVLPLAQIDPAAVQWTNRAVVRAAEGPLDYLQRAPLRRRGFTYSLNFGVAQLSSGDGTHSSGPSGLLHFGYFPSQTLGVLATAGLAWRGNLVNNRLYEQRYGLEVQAMPLAIGIFHAGAYLGGGAAWRLERGFVRGNDRSPTLSAGFQIQLDYNTHVALTARLGVYSGHERGLDEPMREATFGMAIY